MKTINNAHSFLIILVSGLLATFVMTLIGFWQAGIGLNAIDMGVMLSSTMTAAHPELPYGLWVGNIAHFGVGVLLAFIYAAFLQASLPGGWLVRGLTFAIIVELVATVIFLPLVTRTGVFFLNTEQPGMMMISTLIPHLAFGFSLTLAMKVAGLEPAKAEAQAPAATPTATRRDVGYPEPLVTG